MTSEFVLNLQKYCNLKEYLFFEKYHNLFYIAKPINRMIYFIDLDDKYNKDFYNDIVLFYSERLEAKIVIVDDNHKDTNYFSIYEDLFIK